MFKMFRFIHQKNEGLHTELQAAVADGGSGELSVLLSTSTFRILRQQFYDAPDSTRRFCLDGLSGDGASCIRGIFMSRWYRLLQDIDSVDRVRVTLSAGQACDIPPSHRRRIKTAYGTVSPPGSHLEAGAGTAPIPATSRPRVVHHRGTLEARDEQSFAGSKCLLSPTHCSC